MESIVLKHPDKLTKAHYTAIGEITYKWALVEFLIHDLAAYFLRLDKKQGRIVLFKSNLREKCTVLKTAANRRYVKNNDISKKMIDISKRTINLSSDRNNIVHGVWGYETNKPKHLMLLLVPSSADRILPKSMRISSTDLQSYINDVNKLLEDIRNIYKLADVREP